MTKFTRRLKKNKKNRTIKRGGDGNSSENQKDREGVIDMVENSVSNVASSAAKTIGDAGLRIVGLQRVNKDEDNESTKEVDSNINKVADAASGIVSDVENVADKTGAAVIENVNEVLGSDIVEETTEQAAEKTAEIIKESAEKFNEALDKPEVKAEVKETIEKAGEIGAIVVGAAEKPLEKAVDVAANATAKATGAAAAGVTKVLTDFAGAIPGVGAVIDVLKAANDASKAASAVVEAGSEAIEAGSDAFIETKKGVEEGLKLLENQKKTGDETIRRTNNSIKEFEAPVQAAGSRKTRRRLFKNKAKSKRVRFAI